MYFYQLGGKPTVMTILVNPLYPRAHPIQFERTQVLVRGIVEDVTVFPDTWFQSLAEFAIWAIDNGWREKYKCVVGMVPHPQDRRKQLP